MLTAFGPTCDGEWLQDLSVSKVREILEEPDYDMVRTTLYFFHRRKGYVSGKKLTGVKGFVYSITENGKKALKAWQMMRDEE